MVRLMVPISAVDVVLVVPPELGEVDGEVVEGELDDEEPQACKHIIAPAARSKDKVKTLGIGSSACGRDLRVARS